MAKQLNAREVERLTDYQENFSQYFAKRKEYGKRYPYQFLAILKGKILLHSTDLPELLRRLKDDFKADLDAVIIDQL